MYKDQDQLAKVSRSAFQGWRYSIRLNSLFLKSIGAWPLLLSTNIRDKILTVILRTVSRFLIGFLLIPCVLCTVLDPGNLDTKVRMIGPLSFCIMAAMKHYALVSQGDDIAGCIRHIRADWQRAEHFKQQEILITNAKFGRSLTILCATFMYVGGLFYTTVMPLFAKRTEIIGNDTVRSVSFPIYRGLFDPRGSPSFEIVQTLQCLSGFVIYTVTICACSLAAVFVMHACGQFAILTSLINNFVSDTGEERIVGNLKNKLADIVNCHLRILSFISQVEGIMHGICLVELVGCMLNICFLGYYLITEWEQSETIGTLTYLVLLTSFTFNIFILCYIGEILVEQCKNIGLESYMIDWYKLPPKVALNLILIIATSNLSTKLTAGKLVQLSLGSFCNVLKSSLAYLNLLRTMTAIS